MFLFQKYTRCVELSGIVCIFASDKSKNVMGIKRNEVAEPQWEPDDYAKIDKENLFSDELWQYTVDWDTLLYHIKKTENACQMIDRYVYPSRLFSAYIDILEANMYVLDDIFYFQTGIRFGFVYNPDASFKVMYSLRFWNLDSYKKIEQFCDALDRIGNHLMACLKQGALSEIGDRVIKKCHYAKKYESINEDIYNFHKEPAYSYACDAYRDLEIDVNSLVDQIVKILNILRNYDSLRLIINDQIVLFCSRNLITSFRQSEMGQSYIKPWRNDFNGSRDSLILKMEKDPELGPWVNRYTHPRGDKDITAHVFYDDYGLIKNKEETFNTDNWIRILTIAAVLQEYDEHQEAVTKEADDTQILLQNLSLYFKDEETAERFLKQIQGMKDRQIVARVRNYRDAGLCKNTSKDLWDLLHSANLYKSGYKNWNAQLNVK